MCGWYQYSPGSGNATRARVPPADGDRRLRLVRAVGAVVEAQAMPVHRRLEIALVDDVDLDLRALRHAQRRARDRAVVGQHAHVRVADALGDRRDPQLERPARRHVDDPGRAALRQPGRVLGEVVCCAHATSVLEGEAAAVRPRPDPPILVRWFPTAQPPVA